MRILLGISLAAFLMQAQAPVPAPIQRPASLSGRVIQSGTKNPVADAAVELVRITPPPAQPGQRTPTPPRISVRTGDDGGFVLRNIAPGDYRLYATSDNGFVPVEYGQRTATGLGIPLTLGPDQNLAGVTLTMTATASVSGRVTDGFGEPSVFTSMLAFRIVYTAAGARKIEIVQSVLTDDHGEYRLYWLAPGKYFVSAMPIEGRSYGLPLSFASRFGGATYWATPMLGYRAMETGELVEETWRPIYSPGTTDSRAAKAIVLHDGENVAANFDIAASPVRTLQVRGTVLDANGRPLPNARLTLAPSKPEGHSVVLPAASSDDQGRFAIHGVVAGDYSLFVEGTASSGGNVMAIPLGVVLPRGVGPPGSGDFLTAMIPLSVGIKDLIDLSLTAVPVVDIAWHAEFQTRAGGTAATLLVSPVRDPDLAGAPSSYQELRKTAQGGTLTGVSAGDFRISVGQLPRNTYVKSVRSGLTDVLSDGLHVSGSAPPELEIVIRDNAGTIDGKVFDDKRQTASGAMVAMLPDLDLRQHRIDLFKTATSNADGKFHFDGITPGNYRIFAWEDIQPGDWFDAELMRTFENRGVPVHIDEGDTKSIEAVIIPAEAK